MDRYQEIIEKNVVIYPGRVSFELKKIRSGLPRAEAYRTDGYFKGFKREGQMLTITQDEDYHHQGYVLTIGHAFLKEVALIKGGEEIGRIPTEEGGYCYITIDFGDRIDGFTLYFENDLVDSISFSIVYVEADREAWDNKVKMEEEKRRQEAADKTVDIKCATGDKLVNIYFNPLDSSHDHAEIELYRKEGNAKEFFYRIFARYLVPSNAYFLAVDNLVPGEYAFVLKQFDSTGNCIYESSRIDFCVHKPVVPVGRGVVNWP